MSKKFRVLLSAFLSVVIATNSVYVMAAAESVDAFSLPASQADELAADSSAVNTSTSSKATLNIDVTEESDKASESEALIQEINEGRAKGTCANGINWEIDTALILTVSGTGEIGTELPWQRYAQVVEKIIISAGITGLCCNKERRNRRRCHRYRQQCLLRLYFSCKCNIESNRSCFNRCGSFL